MTNEAMTTDGLGRGAKGLPPARMSIDRSAGLPRGGSAIFVLLVAAFLIVGATCIVVFGRGNAEPYILVFLAVLATIGVFGLFALASGILQLSSARPAQPLTKSVVDDAFDGVVVTDHEGRVIYANSAYLDLIGATDAQDARPVERVFIGDADASEAIYRLLKAAREDERSQEEVRIAGLEGRPARWLRMKVRPLKPGKGAAGLTAWSLSDVTRDRELQENFFQVMQRAIDYLDHAPIGFFSADVRGDVVYLNATLATWLGQDLAQVGSGGLKLADLLSGDGAALLTTLRGTPGEVKTEVHDLDLKTRSGGTLPVRLLHRLAFAADGSPGASRTAVLNRARDDGAAAEVRFMRFFHHTPMAIATIDRDGGIVRTNALFARLFQSMLSGTSKDRSIRAIVSRANWPELEAAIGQAAQGKGDIAPVDAMLAGDTTLAGKDERFGRFYVIAVAKQERDQEAAIVYVLETTEQRVLEARLIQQQKMDSIGQLVGGIAHDFNNMLNVIIAANDMLLGTLKPTDPSFHFVMEIRQSANKSATLVRHLMAFSRRQTLRPEVLDLGEVLTDLNVVLKRLLSEKIGLKVEHGRDLWPVKADRMQFEQVITNLAVNARDAMPNGGQLKLRSANVTAQECARYHTKGMPAADYVMVEVADTGTGIPEGIQRQIFEPFFTTKEVGKGTGLGLSTVYGIIKQTGGFIYFDTGENKGTTFRIFLPRHIPTAREIAPPIQPELPAISGVLEAAERVRRAASVDLTGEGTILLVEDEDSLRALNAKGLTSRGYTVLEASNGVEAITMLEKADGKVDLVVSDVVMPEMDGPTLLRELRQRNPDMKIIFVSGYAEDAFQKHLPADGSPPDFLAKPFTLKQLVQKVKETMAA
jgi:two-component system cell cycle sensor histidine kinase/response regulator CckA